MVLQWWRAASRPFADDTIGTRLVQGFSPQQVLETMKEDDASFNRHMSYGGWAQNKSKRDMVAHLRKKGARGSWQPS